MINSDFYETIKDSGNICYPTILFRGSLKRLKMTNNTEINEEALSERENFDKNKNTNEKKQ